ncbi:hypothetical protein M9434_001406 [Picochlorum sp. BPE23]|nr:hypothetical protein M9434_001406 [Picochlorum sp. BPE23]
MVHPKGLDILSRFVGLAQHRTSLCGQKGVSNLAYGFGWSAVANQSCDRLFTSKANGSSDVDNKSSEDIVHEKNQNNTAKESGKPGNDDDEGFVPKVVVFGGSGFVGSKVCQQAINMGLDVVSVSRSGRPGFLSGSAWADSVDWVRSDGTKSDGVWKEVLHGSAGVVSTIGAFGSNEFMYKMCGEVNMNIMEAAKDAGVPRFSFISVHDYSFPGGWQAQNFLLRGYFQGKRDAEARLAKLYPDSGVALRPGMIYGTRHAGNMTIPLGLVGVPLAAALKVLPSKSLAGMPIIGAAFVPPVSVDAVSKAAVTAVVDPQVPAGIMDVWDIQKYSS